MSDQNDEPGDDAVAAAVDLGIAVDKVCAMIEYAKRLDAKVTASGDDDDDEDSGLSDEDWVQVLDDLGDDPILEEIQEFIDGLGEDEQAALVALVWVGRGSHDAVAWAEAVQEATDEHSDHTAEYLMGMPLLADHLESGLDAFGLSC